MNELEAVGSWLQSMYGIQVPANWLSACIEWIQQENEGQLATLEQLRELVFHQWLLADLRQLAAPCLPSNLSTQVCTQLNGQFALQVDSMVDVGIPIYGQLQKVKGSFNENSEISADKPQQPGWEPKPSRMMMLQMTDGLTNILGMEYKSIAALSYKLQPGFKVLIHGPLMCRRGVLMLTSDNLQVLGGEVDSLVETNTPLAVLEKTMEASRVNSGRHERKEFSGQFLNRQEQKPTPSALVKTSLQDNKMSSSFARHQDLCVRGQITRSQYSPMKVEPLHSNDTDPEWEEDLDYGGILNSLENSLEVESITVQHQVTKVLNDKKCDENSINPLRVDRLLDSFRTSISNKIPPRQALSGFKNEDDFVTADYRANTVSGDSPIPRKISACKDLNQKPSFLPKDTFQEEDCLWEDDSNDFDFQHSKDNQSPVIPFQGRFIHKEQQKSSEYTSPGVLKISNKIHSDSLDHSVCMPDKQNQKDSEFLRQTPSEVERLKQENSFPSDVEYLHHDGHLFSRLAASPQADEKKNEEKIFLHTCPITERNPTFNPFKENSYVSVMSLNQSSANACSSFMTSKNVKQEPQVSRPNIKPLFQVSKKVHGINPPPTKQRKLTSMLYGFQKGVQRELVGDTSTQENLKGVQHLTTSASPSQGFNKVLGFGNGVADTNAGKTNNTIEDVILLDSSEDECMEEEATSPVPAQKSMMGEIFSLKIEEMQSKTPPKFQKLDEVKKWQENNNTGETTFTIKGHLTTLTDKLRSNEGNAWSLYCRISDGTSTLDVALADNVLTDLIGFSAKESIDLRQQARKDPKIKDFLSEGLKKCQSTLIEFSGILEIRVAHSAIKPVIINMIQLEKIQR